MEILKFMINLTIFLFYFINFILIEKHFFNHLYYKNNNKKIIIYCIDYTFILLTLIIISFFKIFDDNIFKNESLISIKNKIFLYFPLVYSNQSILNIILSIQLLFKIEKIKKQLISNINSARYNIIFYYFIKNFIILLFESAIIFYLKYKIFNSNKIFYFLWIFQSSLTITSIIMFFFVSKKYKTFLYYSKSFDNNKIMEQKKYENNKQCLLASIEQYCYKNICDILLNFPCILLYTNTKFRKNYNRVLNESSNENNNIYFDLYYYLIIFFGILYLYIFGIMLLHLDYLTNEYKEKLLNILFCIKKFHFYFGKGKMIKNINIIFNKNFNEDKVNYNSYFKEVSDYKDTTQIINDSFSYSESNSSGINSSSESSTEEERGNLFKEENRLDYEYSPCNYFIIFKLLYLYYKINKNVFLDLERMNDNNISKIDNNVNSPMNIKSDFDNTQIFGSMHSSIKSEEAKKYKRFRYNSLYQKKNKGKALNVNIRDFTIIKEKIDNISKLSSSSKNKLIASKKFTLDELYSNIEDENNDIGNFSKSFSIIKEKDESFFNNSSEIDDINKRKSNKNVSVLNEQEIIFSIKSLINDDLFDINPYFNLKIKDIIKSLDITTNMKLFDKFSKEKYKNESYNNYYTTDSLLSFELYDEDFFSDKKLKYFISSYKNYLFDKITNFSYSFLPFIIGIFKIKYMSYSKVVVLYRNPLTFSYNINFHYWLKYIFNDKERKIEASTDKKDIINIDDIETSNNIMIENYEYKNSLEILDSDLQFLQSTIKFNMNFKLNLFILNDEYKNDLFDIDKSEISSMNHNLNNLNDNNIATNALERIMTESMVSFPIDDYNCKKFNFHKKYFGSDDICLLEKLYVNELVNNRYIFKIYFSDIFMRKNIREGEENKKTNLHMKGNDENNSNNSSFIIEEFEDDKENTINQNNLKYCEDIKLKLIKNIKMDKTYD